MTLIEETKTKRIYIRLSPTDHQWLMQFAERRQTNVSRLFRQFIDYLRNQEFFRSMDESETPTAEEEHDADPDVSL